MYCDTLLREKEVEACQVDLLLVGLDLREVGPEGRVQRQRRCEAVLEIEAGVVVLDSPERIDLRQLTRDDGAGMRPVT